MKKLQILSINILNSKYKFILYFILYLIIYSCYYTNIAYNMGNYFSTNSAPETLDLHYYLALQGIQAENRALNSVIINLRQEIIDLKHQIAVNNELSIQQNTLIQNLTLEQKETKALLQELKEEKLKNENEKNIMQAPYFGCMR